MLPNEKTRVKHPEVREKASRNPRQPDYGGRVYRMQNGEANGIPWRIAASPANTSANANWKFRL